MNDLPVVIAITGASGACYAFMLYAATMAPNAQIICLIVRVPLWLLAAILVCVGLYSTFTELVGGYGGGVSHGAHLGGALIGHLAYRFDWLRDYRSYGDGPGPIDRLRASWRAQREAARRQKAAQKEQVLDDILAKVKQHGLGSLTPEERRFLEKTSEESRRS